MDQVSILIVDCNENDVLYEGLHKVTQFNILGKFNNIDLAFTQAERLQPNIILLNVDITGFDGIAVAEAFALEFPLSSIILLTESDNKRILRYALQVGAKDVINLPIEEDRLIKTVKRVAKQEKKRREVFTIQKKEKPKFKTITVFSTKGGVGKTTLALNLALKIRKLTKKKVVLVDLDLMFGNIGLMSGLMWKNSVKDLVDELNNLDGENLDNFLTVHPSGLRILPAPIQTEYASLIQAEHIEKILNKLSEMFNYVIIDAPTHFHDTVIPALERADDIVLVSTLDLASIQNLKQCLEILNGLSIANKARIVVNKLGFSEGLSIQDLESEIGMEINSVISNCEKAAIGAVNLGEPIVLSVNKTSQIAREFEDLTLKLIDKGEVNSKTGWYGLLARKKG